MCQARRARGPPGPAGAPSAGRRPVASDISTHQVDQMLDGCALRSRWSGLRRYAVADPGAFIEKVPKSDSAGALRSFQYAPQAHRVHCRCVVLQFLDIVYESRIYAPIILIILK